MEYYNITMLTDFVSYRFGLFSAVASIVEEKMEPFLEKIVKSMLASVESTEGLIVSC